ncbi:response regulator [Pseudoxanthomonas composti]|uniref:Response regulator n=1 Tax=Pseudoxanthomonas composti TaxID=2137479 RepID=A0A4Q1JS04_9GAMM|nr:response regulator [Pseudoxanthomonas composti]
MTRVLIVEDEFLVAMMLEECLEILGYQVVGTMASLEAGLAALSTQQFDVAMLDMNLSGQSSEPIAQALETQGMPFLFVTGYGQAGVPAQYRTRQIVQKPFHLSELKAALEASVNG